MFYSSNLELRKGVLQKCHKPIKRSALKETLRGRAHDAPILGSHVLGIRRS
jgi:hypothetical protein